MLDIERLERLSSNQHYDALVLLKKFSRAFRINPFHLSATMQVVSGADGTKYSLASMLFPEKDKVNFSCTIELTHQLNDDARAFLFNLREQFEEAEYEFMWEEPSTVFIGWGEYIPEFFGSPDTIDLSKYIWGQLRSGVQFALSCTHILKACSTGLRVNRGNIIWGGASAHELSSFCIMDGLGVEPDYDD